MTGGDATPKIAQTDKPFTVTNIKAHVPIILDLDKHNYNSWSELFKTHCMSYGVIHLLDGSSSSNNDPEWVNLVYLVKSWLYGTISEHLLDMVLTPDVHAKDVWANLKAVFHENKDAQVIQICNDLRNIKMGNATINEYFVKIKKMSEHLKNIDSPVTDKNLVMYAINGLSEKFSHIARIIRHTDPLPTLTSGRTTLLLEESSIKPPTQSTLCDNSSSPLALVTTNNRTRNDPSPTICRNFQKGICRYGDQCRYLHWQPTKNHPNPPPRNPSRGRQQQSWATPGLQHHRQQQSWVRPNNFSGPHQPSRAQQQWVAAPMAQQHSAHTPTQPSAYFVGHQLQPQAPGPNANGPSRLTSTKQQL